MKIFCIGRNYADHIHELKNDKPTEPVVFMKPPTALLKDNKPFYIPAFSQNIHYECELVLHMGRTGKGIRPTFAMEYIDAITVGIDFTARDIQDKQKEKKLPWEIAKSFDHSAVIGKWVPIDKINMNEAIEFSLQKNETIVQRGSTNMMLFNFTEIICYISKYFTIQKGDIIYTGTPQGVSNINIGDHLSGFIFDELCFDMDIK